MLLPTFLYPLLTTPTDNYAGDELFAVLESLSLAFVMVGQQNNLVPLRPYIVLRDLGTMRDGSERILHYDSANPIIRNWISTGQVTAEFGDKKVKSEQNMRINLDCKINERLAVVSGPEHHPDERKTALVELLSDVLRSYGEDGEAYWDSVSLNRSALSHPPYWPAIRNTSDTPDIIVRSIESLLSGIQQVKTRTTHGL